MLFLWVKILFQQITARATDNRKRKEDDQKKLDLAKQLELVSEIYGNYKEIMVPR